MKLPGRHSLFWTVGGAFVGAMLLAIVVQWILVFALAEPVARRLQLSHAHSIAVEVAEEVSVELAGGRADTIPRMLRERGREALGLQVFWRTPGGRWVGVDRAGPGVQRRLDELARDDSRPVRRRGRRSGPPMEVAARAPVSDAGGEVFVLRPVGRVSPGAFLPQHTVSLLLAALLIAALVSLWIVRRFQFRLARLEAQAERVGHGDFSARVEQTGLDEIGRVGVRLNAMTERLAEARAELEAADEQRRQLFADITHELTTPLTAIRGYAETLLDGQVQINDADRRRFLEDLVHSAGRMDRLISELLDLARLEAHGTPLQTERIDLRSLAHHSAARMQQQFEAAGRVLRDLAGEGPPVEIDADGLRMEQVVDNLLRNALRHVPSGGEAVIEVRAEAERVVLEVRDNGPGFPEEDLPKVFDRFYRADRSRTVPGSGLGLAIVREIVRAHGGEVSASNGLDGGAVLRVDLPRIH